MKTKILILALSFASVFSFAQDSTATQTADSLGHCQNVPGEMIPQIVDASVAILNATHNVIIPGVDNTITGALISLVLVGIVTAIRKRRKKRKAKKQSNEQ